MVSLHDFPVLDPKEVLSKDGGRVTPGDFVTKTQKYPVQTRPHTSILVIVELYMMSECRKVVVRLENRRNRMVQVVLVLCHTESTFIPH